MVEIVWPLFLFIILVGVRSTNKPVFKGQCKYRQHLRKAAVHPACREYVAMARMSAEANRGCYHDVHSSQRWTHKSDFRLTSIVLMFFDQSCWGRASADSRFMEWVSTVNNLTDGNTINMLWLTCSLGSRALPKLFPLPMGRQKIKCPVRAPTSLDRVYVNVKSQTCVELRLLKSSTETSIKQIS